MGPISERLDKFRKLVELVGQAGQFAKKVGTVLMVCAIVVAGCALWATTLFTMFVLGYRY